MKFTSLDMSNFGPIETGTIGGERITVFFGPSNSGKSIAAKLVHAASLLKTMKEYDGQRVASHVLHHCGLTPRSAVTHGRRKCIVTIHGRKTHASFKFSTKSMTGAEFHVHKARPDGTSVYVPASRTGIVESFYSITKMRNELLNELLMSVADGNVPHFDDSFPVITNDFYEMVLDAMSNGVDHDVLDSFETLTGGSITQRDDIMHTLEFQDQYGASVRLQDAGAGILSIFSILLGISRVNIGGRCVIEEPETGLDPLQQFKLVDMICHISKSRRIKVTMATHDNFVVHKLLSLVSRGVIRRAEIGLYYFDRDECGLTTIKKMPVGRDGDAEQPIFQKAVESLLDEFSR